MRIAEAAKELGLPTHRLRHYEEVGLLRPSRSPSGYREYGPQDVDRARLVCELLEAGFSAKDAALMLPCMARGRDPGAERCAATQERLRERLKEIRSRRLALEHTEKTLTAWLNVQDDESSTP